MSFPLPVDFGLLASRETALVFRVPKRWRVPLGLTVWQRARGSRPEGTGRARRGIVTPPFCDQMPPRRAST